MICTSVVLCAQDRTTHAWSQIETTQINREEPRAFFVPHFTTAQASKILSIDDVDKIYDTDSAKVLSGKWKFFFAQNESDVSQKFFEKNFNDTKWDAIDVPCSWQLRGYEKSIFYNNTDLELFYTPTGAWLPQFSMKDGGPSEFALNPVIPEIHRQRGIYRTNFTVPQNWDGKNIFIRFNGVRTGYNFYVNGKFVGYSEDSFTPAEFDITKFLQDGANTLAVEVFKFTTGAASEIQDMPQIMGISRDVVLLARSPLHIRDYYAPLKMSADLKTAQIDFNIDVRNLAAKKSDTAQINAFLIDAQDGKKIPLFTKKISQIGASASTTVKETVKLDSFKLWSPDAPNYYQLVMELADANGKALETIAADWGFRRFDWKNADNQFFFNNAPYLIKGTNHHDWSPDKGKAVDFAWLKKDFELFKNANINSVRTSHYPKDDKFYMLATRYGIALMDENNYETHKMWDQFPAQLDNWVPQAVFKMRNMVVRDRNIPSVIMFSTNNESAPSNKLPKALDAMEKLSRVLDPTRPVHSESAINAPDNGVDFESPMYGNVHRMNAYLHKKEPRKPFFFCEYTHGMGNASGNLKDTWDMIRAHKDLNGGYIWDWVDQSTYMPREDKPDEMFISDARDWNFNPHAGNFCQNGLVFADRTYGVKYTHAQQIYQDVQMRAIDAASGTFKFTNEFISTNLKEFDAVITIERDGEKLAENKLPPLDLKPGESKEISLKLPKFDTSKPGLYTATIEFFRKQDTAFALKGTRIAYDQFEVANNASFGELHLKNEAVSLAQKGGEVSVKTGNVEIKFIDGDMHSYKVGGLEMLVEPMVFDMSSAWIDNMIGSDRRTLEALEMYSMKELSNKVSAKKLTDNCVEINVQKSFANNEGDGYATEMIYRIIPGGAVQTTGYFRKINELPKKLPLPRIGVKMRLNKQLGDVEFLGRGPWMNYVDRQESQIFGRYKVEVNEGYEKYSRPQDQGNRQDVRWAAFTDKSGKGLLFAAPEKPLPFAWLGNTQKELWAAKHPHNLPESLGAEVRIAQYVTGVGNASCGPRTLDKYSNFFDGEVMWNFHMLPISSNKNLNELGSKIWPAKFNQHRAPESENIVIGHLKNHPTGAWISEGASVSYSSTDTQWAPKKDTLTTTMEGLMSFHTNKENRPWLVVDLGSVKEIQGAQIINRNEEGLYNRAVPLEMFVSSDNQKWEKVWRTEAAKREWLIGLDKPVKARYVKLQVAANSVFHLKGVKIFGPNK